MTIIRWKNRPAYQSFFNNLLDSELDTGFEKNNGYRPATNIIENAESFLIELAAPGRDKKEFQLHLDNRVLSITAGNPEEQENADQNNGNENFLIREFFSKDSFTRSFSLPKKADTENIKANYKNGVLTITIPKVQPEPTVTRSIEVA